MSNIYFFRGKDATGKTTISNSMSSKFEERLKNPTPNQYFKSADEIIAYYGKSDIQLLEDEYYIDSANSLESILEYVFNIINR